MKKFYFLAFCLCLLNIASAQGVSKLFGLVGGSPQSNHASNGFLFSTDSTGQGFQLRYQFPVTTPGGSPGNVEMAAYNGKLYGTTMRGGASDYGIIFEYDPVTNNYASKFEFTSPSGTGGGPRGSLLLYNNKFYGLATDYGVNGVGCLFEWDPATNVFTKRFDFTGNGGAFRGGSPQNSLRLMNGKMYGTTVSGGASGLGVVFEWDPATNAYTTLLDLNGTNGWGFYNNVTPYNNKIYCMSQQGAVNNAGALYVIDPSLPNGSNTTVIKNFDGASGTTGNNNEMIVYNNKLYGCLYQNGTDGSGTLFELDPSSNTFAKLLDFNYTNTGRNPQGKLVANGSSFLGFCSSGGVNGTGVIYEWNPATPTMVTKKYDFPANNFDNQRNPGSTLTYINNKFYAVTSGGGPVDMGTLIEYDYATGTVTKKRNFNTAENGRIPVGKPVLLNGKLYGVCYQGPQEIFGTPYGCLWSYDPSTDIYSRKFLFDYPNNAVNGRAPISAPIAYNNKLYGTTTAGGNSDWGVLYEYDPVSNAFVKKDFVTIGGRNAIGEPTVYNAKMYGMTNAAGAGNNGIIYSYDPATGILAKLYDVQTSGLNAPTGAFVAFNNKLYGAVGGAGTNNVGGIIAYDPASNTATNVFSFATSTGYNVNNAMTVYNGKLYGTALNGGTSGRGVLFEFDPVTNNYSVLYNFNTTPGGNGYDPQGEVTVSGNKLYTITRESDKVQVVQYDLTTSTVTTRSVFTPANNFNLPTTHNSLTVVPAFIANGLANSCETYPVVVINSSNNNQWVPILNSSGDVVAEIKANGNNLGNVTAGTYINNGTVREDGQRRLYMDRNITISVQNNTISGNVDLRLYVKKSEYDALRVATNSLGQPSGVNTINDVAVYKTAEACVATITAPSSKIIPVASNYEYGYVLAFSVNSFSSFYFASAGYTTLPVTLLSFNASKRSTEALLQWQTANETNVANYEVERSVDGRSFQLIGTKAANNLSGSQYQLIDEQPVKGNNYYRLKMIDRDGSFAYSNTPRVYFDGKTSISIWPNPASEAITISEATVNDRIRIIDATGAIVLQQIIKGSNESINIGKLSKGIYVVELSSNGMVMQAKLVKR